MDDAASGKEARDAHDKAPEEVDRGATGSDRAHVEDDAWVDAFRNRLRQNQDS